MYNNLTKPVLLDIYESKECQGVISPYILKDFIMDMVGSMFEKHQKLYDMLGSIPNGTFVHGSADCVTMDSTAWNPSVSVPCNQQPNNINTERYPQGAGNCTVLGEYSKVLPPHKVSFACADKPTFESNIYNPCIIPLKGNQATSESKSTYNTGGYPDDTTNYPTLDQVNDIQDSCSCNCCDQPNYAGLTQNRDAIQHESFLWLEKVRDIQISNLIYSLVEANKIPVDPDLMFWMRKILYLILSNQLFTKVRKFGVLLYTQRTISAPHIKRCRQLFIQVNTDNTTRQQIATELAARLSTMSQSFSVMVLTEKEYDFYRQHYPIEVCFNCTPASMVSKNIPMMEMVMVNDNQFIPKIYLKFITSNIVEIMAPADCMHVSAGTSGSVSFRIGANNTHDWAVNGITVNNHKYALEDLLNAHNQDMTGHPGIREYEFSALSAEITESEGVPYSYSTLTLFYTNVTSDITISFDTIPVIPKTEFDIDRNSIKTSVYNTLPMDLSLFLRRTQYGQDITDKTEENKIPEDNISDVTGSTEPSEGKNELFGINLHIPFSGICKEARNLNLIKLYQVIRDPITKEIIRKLYCMSGIFGIAGYPSNSSDKSSLSYDKHLTVTDTNLDSNIEYELIVSQGALWVSGVKSNEYSTTYSPYATNQDITLRFAVNVTTKEIEILNDDDELPSFFLKKMTYLN